MAGVGTSRQSSLPCSIVGSNPALENLKVWFLFEVNMMNGPHAIVRTAIGVRLLTVVVRKTLCKIGMSET